jgi:hypothetical protein
MPSEATTQPKKKYKVFLKNVHLFVTVGVMREKIYKDIKLKQEHQPLHYHYRKQQVRVKTIPIQTIEYESETMYSGGQVPCRITVGVVELGAYQGDPNQDPYMFKRRFRKDNQDLLFINEHWNEKINAKSEEDRQARMALVVGHKDDTALRHAQEVKELCRQKLQELEKKRKSQVQDYLFASTSKGKKKLHNRVDTVNPERHQYHLRRQDRRETERYEEEWPRLQQREQSGRNGLYSTESRDQQYRGPDYQYPRHPNFEQHGPQVRSQLPLEESIALATGVSPGEGSGGKGKGQGKNSGLRQPLPVPGTSGTSRTSGNEQIHVYNYGDTDEPPSYRSAIHNEYGLDSRHARASDFNVGRASADHAADPDQDEDLSLEKKIEAMADLCIKMDKKIKVLEERLKSVQSHVQPNRDYYNNPDEFDDISSEDEDSARSRDGEGSDIVIPPNSRTNFFWIESITLSRDGIPVENMSQWQTFEDAGADYYNLLARLGFLQTGMSPGISKELFNSMHYLKLFDLSSDGLTSNYLNLPNTIQGGYILKIKFDKQTTRPLSVIILEEYTEVLTMKSNNTWSKQYMNAYEEKNKKTKS